MKTEELDQVQEINFDEEHLHIADGPPFVTTLCGIDVIGQIPNPKSTRPECPICKAIEIYGLT